MKRLFAIISLTVMTALTAAGQEVRVTSSFEPSILQAGELGTYRFTVSWFFESNNVSIQIDGSSIDFSQIQSAPGLEMTYIGPQTQMPNMLNSMRTVGISYQFRVRSNQAGDYKIPAFPVTVKGKTYTVPAATLKVVEGSPHSALQEKKYMWLELILPREKIFVGESIPFQVRLYIHTGLSVDRVFAPRKEGDAFAISDFVLADERRIERDGQIYTEVIWQSVITPYKAGEYPLVFKEDIQVYEQAGNQQDRFSDPFMNFFGRSMFRRGQVQKVTLSTPENARLTISELPVEGRPENFTGAIGLFKVRQPDVTPGVAEVGEPMNLRFIVEGSGNFNRIEAPELLDAADWREYPPEEEFMPTDRYDYQGRKIFDYVIIPRSEEIVHTPEIAFNYFNPDSEEYVDLTLSSRPVEIKPAAPGQQRPLIARQDNTPAPRQAELLPIKTSPGKWVASMQPLFMNPVFLAGQAVPLVALLALVITRRKHNRLLSDARYARDYHARKALAKWLAAARKAAASGEHQTFYAFAQRAIQEAVGRLVEQTSESLSSEEIEQLLLQYKVDAQTRQQIAGFLGAGEALKFGGISQDVIDLKSEFASLESLTANLMKLS